MKNNRKRNDKIRSLKQELNKLANEFDIIQSENNDEYIFDVSLENKKVLSEANAEISKNLNILENDNEKLFSRVSLLKREVEKAIESFDKESQVLTEFKKFVNSHNNQDINNFIPTRNDDETISFESQNFYSQNNSSHRDEIFELFKNNNNNHNVNVDFGIEDQIKKFNHNPFPNTHIETTDSLISNNNLNSFNSNNESNSIPLNLFTQIHELFENEIKKINVLSLDKINFLNDLFANDKTLNKEEKSKIIKSKIVSFINDFNRDLNSIFSNSNINDVTKKEIKVIKNSYSNTILNSYSDLEIDLIRSLISHNKNFEQGSILENGVNYVDTSNISDLKLAISKIENEIESEKSKWAVSNFSKETLEDYLFLNKIDSLSVENFINNIYFNYCEEFIKKVEIKKEILSNLVNNFILYVNDNCNQLIVKLTNEFKLNNNKQLGASALSNNNFFNQKSIELIESLKSKSSKVFKSLESYISELLSNASLESLRKNEINFDFISTFVKESIKDLNSKVQIVIDLSNKELSKIINLETVGFDSLKNDIANEINEIFKYLDNSSVELEEVLKDVHDINKNFLLSKLNKLENVLMLVKKYKDTYKDYDNFTIGNSNNNNYLDVRLERLERQYSKIINMLDPIANRINSSKDNEHLESLESRINSKIDQLISNIIDDKKDYENKYSIAIEEILKSNELQKQNIIKIIKDLEEEKLNIISEESKKNAVLNSNKLSELENLIAVQNDEIEVLLREKDEFILELESFISNKKNFNDEKIEDIKNSINQVIDSFNTKISEFEYNFDRKLTTLNLESIDLVNDKNVKLFTDIEKKLTNNYEVVKHEVKNDLTQILNNVNELNNTYSLLKDQNALQDDKFNDINNQFSQFSFLLKNISESLVNKNGEQQEEISNLVNNLNDKFEKLITNLKTENYKSSKKINKKADIANKKLKNIFDNSISELNNKFDNFISEVKKENKLNESNQNNAINLVIESNRKQKESIDKIITDLEKSNSNLLSEIDERAAKAENSKLKQLEELISLQNTELENLLIDKNEYVREIETFLRNKKEKMTVEGLDELRKSIEAATFDFNKKVEDLEFSFSRKIDEINLDELDSKLTHNQADFFSNIENKLSQNFDIVRTEFNSNIDSIIKDIDHLNADYANLNIDGKFNDINDQFSQFSFILKGISETFADKNIAQSEEINNLIESLNSKFLNLISDIKNENAQNSSMLNANIRESNNEIKLMFDNSLNEINSNFESLKKSVQHENKLLEQSQNNAINLIIESNEQQKKNINKVIAELEKSNSTLLSEIDQRAAKVENSKLRQLEELITLQNSELENLLIDKNEYIHEIETFLKDKKEKLTIEGLEDLRKSLENVSFDFNKKVEDLEFTFNRKIDEINLNELDSKLTHNQVDFFNNIEGKLSQNFDIVRTEFNSNINSIIKDINDINTNYANLNFDDKFNDINDQFSQFSFILKGISESFADKNSAQSEEINNLVESLNVKFLNLINDLKAENLENSNKLNQNVRKVNAEIKSLFDNSLNEINSRFESLRKYVEHENKLLEKGQNNAINLIIESNEQQRQNINKVISELEKSNSYLLSEIDQRAAKVENSKLRQLEELIALQNTELENLLIDKNEYIHEIETFLRDKKEKMTVEGLEDLRRSLENVSFDFNKKVEDLEFAFNRKIDEINLNELDSKLINNQADFFNNIENKLSHNFDIVRSEFNSNINSIIKDINDINANYANLNFDDKFNDINDQFSQFSFILKGMSESIADKNSTQSEEINNLVSSLNNKFENLVSDIKSQNHRISSTIRRDVKKSNKKVRSALNKSLDDVNSKFNDLFEFVQSKNKLLENSQNNAINLIIESNEQQRQNINKVISELEKSNSNLLSEIDQRAAKVENSKLRQLEELIALQNTELENLLIDKNEYIHEIETFLSDKKEKMTVEGLEDLRRSLENVSFDFNKKVEDLEFAFNRKIDEINLNELDSKLINNQTDFFNNIENKLSHNFDIVRSEFNSNINSIIKDINDINANYANLNFDDKFNDINDQFSQFSFILKGISESFADNNSAQSKEINNLVESLNLKFLSLINDLKTENLENTNRINENVREVNVEIKTLFSDSLNEINSKFESLKASVEQENKLLENSQNNAISLIVESNRQQKQNINRVISELEKTASNLLSEIDQRAAKAENSKLRQLEELISLQNTELENLLVDKNEYIHEIETFLREKKEKMTVEGLDELKKSLETASFDFNRKVEDLEFAFNRKFDEINLDDLDRKLTNNQADFFNNIESKLSQNFDIVRNEFNSNINSIISDINDLNANYANLNFDSKFNDINNQFSQFSFILKGISESFADKNISQSEEINKLTSALTNRFDSLVSDLKSENMKSLNLFSKNNYKANKKIKSIFNTSISEINNKFDSILKVVNDENKLLEKGQNNAISLIIESNEQQKQSINKVIAELENSNSNLLSEIDKRAAKAENSKLRQLEELISLQNTELENLLIDKNEYINEVEKFLISKKESLTIEGLEELKTSLDEVNQNFNRKVEDLEFVFNQKIGEINLKEINSTLFDNQQEFFSNIEYKLSQNFEVIKNEFNSNINSIINDINANYANLNFNEKFSSINDQFSHFSFLLKNITESVIDKNSEQSKEINNLVDNLNIKFTTLISDLRNENLQTAANLNSSVEKASEKFEDIFRKTISNINERFNSFTDLISSESKKVESHNNELINKILLSNREQQNYIFELVNKIESSNADLLAKYESIRTSEESIKLKELEELILLQNEELSSLLSEKNDYVSEVENFLSIKKEELNNQNLIEIKQSVKDVINVFNHKINDLEIAFDRKFGNINLNTLNHELVSSQKDFFENVESKLSNNYELVRTEFKQDIGEILNNINYLSEKYENSSNFDSRFNDIDEQLSQFRSLMKDMSEAFISKNNDQYNEINDVINRISDNFNSLLKDIKNDNNELNAQLLENINSQNTKVKENFDLGQKVLASEFESLSNRFKTLEESSGRKHFEIVDSIIENNKNSQKEISALIRNIEDSNDKFLTEIEIRNNNINNLKLKDLENLISIQNSEIEALLDEKNEFIYDVENILLDRKMKENDINFEKIQSSINNVISSLNSKIYDLEIGFDKKLANIDISSLKGDLSDSQNQFFSDIKNQLTGNYEVLKIELNNDLNRILNSVSNVTEEYERNVSKFDNRFNEIDNQFNEFRHLFKNVTESLLTKNSENYEEISRIVENLDNKFISLISNIKNENLRNNKKISKEISKVKNVIDKKIEKSIDKIDDKFGLFLNEIKEQNKYFENKQLDTINSIIEGNKNNQKEILSYIKNFENSNAEFISQIQAERFNQENSKLRDLEQLINLQNTEIDSLLTEKNDFVNEVENFIHNKKYELDSKNIKNLENSINTAIENFDSKINLLELNFDKKLNRIDLSSLSDLISNEQLQLVDSVQNSLTYNYELVKNEFRSDLNQILNNISMMNENYEVLLSKNYDSKFDSIDDQFNSFRLILKELTDSIISKNSSHYDELDAVIKNVNNEFNNIINNLKNEGKENNKYLSNKIKKSNKKLERKIDSSLFEMNSKFDKFLEEMKIQTKNIENNNSDTINILVESNRLNQREIFNYIQQLENIATGLVSDFVEIQNRKDALKLKELEELINLQNSEIESLIEDKNNFIDDITLFLSREKELVTNENFEKLEKSVQNIITAFNKKISNLEFNLENKISNINLDSLSDKVKEEKADLLNSVENQLHTNFDVVKNTLNFELTKILESVEEVNNIYIEDKTTSTIKFDELNSQFDQFRTLLKEVTEGFINKNDSDFERINELTRDLDNKFESLLLNIKSENDKNSTNLYENISNLNRSLLDNVNKEFNSNTEKFNDFINKLDEKTRIFEETQIDLISSLFETNRKYQEIVLSYINEIENSNNDFINQLDQRTKIRENQKLKELENLIALQNNEINELLDENNKYINDVEEFLLSKKEAFNSEKLEKIEKSVLNISEIFNDKISKLESSFENRINSINFNELEKNLSIAQNNIFNEIKEKLFRNYELLKIEFNENFNSVLKVVDKFYDYFNNNEANERNRYNEYLGEFEQIRNILTIISGDILDKNSRDYELINDTVSLINQKIESVLTDIKYNNENSLENISNKIDSVSFELTDKFNTNLSNFENKYFEILGVVRDQVDDVKNSNITSINLMIETNRVFKEEIKNYIEIIRNDNNNFLSEIDNRRVSESAVKLNELSNLIDLQNAEIDNLLTEKVEFIEKVERFLVDKKDALVNSEIVELRNSLENISKTFDKKIEILGDGFSNKILDIRNNISSIFDQGYNSLKDQQVEFIEKIDSRIELNFEIVKNKIKTGLIEVISEIEKLNGYNENFVTEINNSKINEITDQFESFNLLLKDVVDDIVERKDNWKDFNLTLNELNTKFNNLISDLRSENSRNGELIVNELSQLRYDIKDDIFASFEALNQNFEQLINEIKSSNKNLENSQIDAINLIVEANNLNKKELVNYINILKEQSSDLINELDRTREENLILKIKELENLIDLQNNEIELLFADKEKFILALEDHINNIKSFENDYESISKTSGLFENLLKGLVKKIDNLEIDLSKKIDQLNNNNNKELLPKTEILKIEENILNNYTFLKEEFNKLFESLSKKIEDVSSSSNDNELKENINRINEELSNLKNLENISIDDLRIKNLLLEKLEDYVSEKLETVETKKINNEEISDSDLIEKINKLEKWYEDLSNHLDNKNNFIKDYVDNKINEVKTPSDSEKLDAKKIYNTVLKNISEVVNLLNLSKNNMLSLSSKISTKIEKDEYFSKSLIWLKKLLSYNEKIINEVTEQNKKYLESIAYDEKQNNLAYKIDNLIFVLDLISKNESILKNEFSTFELELKAFNEINKKDIDKKVMMNFLAQFSSLIRENTELVSRLFVTFDSKKDSNMIKLHSIEDLLKQAKDNIDEINKLDLNESTISIFLKELDKVKNLLLTSHFDLLVLKENEIEKSLLSSKNSTPIEFKKISLLEDLVKYTKDDLKNVLSQKIKLVHFLTVNNNNHDKDYLLEFKASEIYDEIASKLTKKQIEDINKIINKFNEIEKDFYKNKTNILSAKNIKNKSLMYSQISKLELEIMSLFNSIENKKNNVVELISGYMNSNEDTEIKKLIDRFENSKELIESEFQSEINAFKEMINNSKKEEIENYKKELSDLEKELSDAKSKSTNTKEFEPLENLIEELHLEITSFEQEKENQYKEIKSKLEYLNSLSVSDDADISNTVNTDKFKLNLNSEVKEFIENEFNDFRKEFIKNLDQVKMGLDLIKSTYENVDENEIDNPDWFQTFDDKLKNIESDLLEKKSNSQNKLIKKPNNNIKLEINSEKIKDFIMETESKKKEIEGFYSKVEDLAKIRKGNN